MVTSAWERDYLRNFGDIRTMELLAKIGIGIGVRPLVTSSGTRYTSDIAGSKVGLGPTGTTPTKRLLYSRR